MLAEEAPPRRSLKDRHTSAKEVAPYRAERETPTIKPDDSPPPIEPSNRLQRGAEFPQSCRTAVNQTYLPQSEAPATSEVSIFSFQGGEVFFFLPHRNEQNEAICSATVAEKRRPRENMKKHQDPRTLCSMASRLLRSFKKLSFSR